MKPVVPLGKTAVSIAIWPCRTRVKARFSSGFGVPKCCSGGELQVERFFRFTYPCSCHVSSAIEKLCPGVAEVDLVLVNSGGVRGAGLVMNNRGVRPCRRDGGEGQALEMVELPG